MFVRKRELQAMRQLMESQALIIDDITSVQARQATGTYGNPYWTYAGAVIELARKYEGVAKWGVLQTGNIIDIRAAFTIGPGISVFPKDKKNDPAVAEMEFIRNFFAFNDLDREMAQEFAKEAEIEGRWLGVFNWDAKEKMVSLRVRSWTSTQYTVVTDPQDYAWFTKILYKDPTGADQTIQESDFVYSVFSGRVHQPYQPLPKVAKCLMQLENLDKALWDWREINRLFASPVPHIQCDTSEQATYMGTAINAVAKNWRIKKLFAHVGKLEYAVPGDAGVKSLEQEIITNAKMISGTTGVPVHFLGLPELMSGRGTIGSGLMQLVNLSTSKERAIWMGTYEEIILKAMEIYNDKMGLAQKSTKLDSAKLQIAIPFISDETWDQLEKFWLPLKIAGEISTATFLSKIPSVDVDEEQERLAEETAKKLEKFSGVGGGISKDVGGQGQNGKNSGAGGDRSDPSGGNEKPGTVKANQRGMPGG